MDIRELKKIYYSLLANDPDYPAWEEFEYCNLAINNISGSNRWQRITAPINTWDIYYIEYRHNPKPKQWQPVGGGVIIDLGNDEINLVDEHRQDAVDTFTKNGLVRTNQEQAEQDLKQIRQFCRFLAWRAENCCYTNAILPALDYVGCFLNKTDYSMLKILIDSGEIDL